MAYAPTARHHLRAEDLADSRYAEPLDVTDLAKAAGSPPRTLLHREGGARDSRGRVVPEMGGFRDPSGNHIRLTQVRELAVT